MEKEKFSLRMDSGFIAEKWKSVLRFEKGIKAFKE